MDFETLLHVAKKNQQLKKEPVKCLQTKFKPPTKEQREKDKALSEGVQRFLARKEAEERRKRLEEERKREELNALRAKDPKANKRIQTMLKRTKSANKSVMSDVDASNTADTLAGPSQPDEDDYGFVSETASALYNKLIQKMYNTPSGEVPKFAPSKKPTSGNLSNTKERVKMALMRQEEEERLPHKRKRRKKDGGGEEEGDLYFEAPDRNVDDISGKSSGKSEKPKPKRPPGPPPMDFIELLKLAEKKQHEPIVIEPKVKKVEPEQLLTKKQQEEQRKLEEWRKQREERLRTQERCEKPDAIKRIPKIGDSKTDTVNLEKNHKLVSKSNQNGSERIPKLGHSSSDASKSIKTDSKVNKYLDHSKNGALKSSDIRVNDVKQSVKLKVNDRIPRRVESETEKLKRERDEALRILKEKEEAYKVMEEKERLIRERDEALARLRALEEKEAKLAKPPKAPEVKKVVSKTAAKDFRKPELPKGAREFPPKDVRRPEPPKSIRDFPPKDVQRPVKSGRPLTKEEIVRKRLAELKRRKIEESDEEYDSELDDFIVDESDPTMEREDISAVISQIFKYDKNKYSRYDDDGECMESNWAQISKEEYISTKCGILEDLEDMKAEKEALARKKKIKR